MKRGTPAPTAASSSTPCRSTITSRNPLSAETTHAVPSHAPATEPASAVSAGVTVKPSADRRSRSAADASSRTSARTAAPRPMRASAIRVPRSPAAPARTMVGWATPRLLWSGGQGPANQAGRPLAGSASVRAQGGPGRAGRPCRTAQASQQTNACVGPVQKAAGDRAAEHAGRTSEEDSLSHAKSFRFVARAACGAGPGRRSRGLVITGSDIRPPPAGPIRAR